MRGLVRYIVWGVVGLGLYLGAACETKVDEPTPGEPVVTTEQTVSEVAPDIVYESAHLQPDKWTPLRLGYQSYQLPKELRQDATLSILVHGNELWFGGKKGLFRLQNGAFKQEDDKPVVGLALWAPKDQPTQIVIGRSTSLDLWFRGLVPSSLNGKLGGATITSLHTMGDGMLWIGTSTGLVMVKGEQLTRLDQLKNIKRVNRHPQAPDLVLEAVDGSLAIIRPNGEGWGVRAPVSPKGKSVFKAVSPINSDSFWGVADGLLYYRVLKGGLFYWWPFIVDPEAKAATKGGIPTVGANWMVSRLGLNPKTGDTWAIVKGQLLLLGAKTIQQMPIPEELSALAMMTFSPDGSMWLSDGDKLLRVGSEQKSVSYKQDLKPFLEQSCVSCHKEGGIASHFLVGTYNDAKAGAEKMIKRIANGTMPPPPAKLIGGDADLIRRWMKDGYQQ